MEVYTFNRFNYEAGKYGDFIPSEERYTLPVLCQKLRAENDTVERPSSLLEPLLEFATKVDRRNPHQFQYAIGMFSFTMSGGRRCRTIHVCDPRSPYAVGTLKMDYKVGYGDEYLVYAKTISNQKEHYGDAHYTKRSVNLTRAVRNARDALRPCSMESLAHDIIGQYTAERNDMTADARRKLKTFAESLSKNLANVTAKTIYELYKYHKYGKDTPPVLSDKLYATCADYEEGKGQERELSEALPSAVFYMNAFNPDRITVFEYAFPVTTEYVYRGETDKYLRQAYICTLDELPPYIMERATMLAMVNEGEYLPGVGIHVEADQYVLEPMQESVDAYAAEMPPELT